jgi:superfamily I DNA/RNA helicase
MRAIEKGAAFDDAARQRMAELIDKANEKAPSKNLFSAIFIDETQDLSTEELSSVLSLSENVCVCGDGRQGIYKQDGIDIGKKLGLTPHLLKKHYRIGHRIARVADRLMPPTDGMDSLETTSNYNPKTQGESSARMHDSPSREGQFITMLEILRVQLVAFKGDTIGIFCATKESLAELQARFTATDLSDFVAIHARDSVDGGFSSDRPIHVMTMHAAKGTEFRAVHLYGVEELKGFPLNSRHLGYTAVTRAKTALNAYRTGETNKPLESAFAEPAHMELSDLFPGGV